LKKRRASATERTLIDEIAPRNSCHQKKERVLSAPSDVKFAT
jgi:hypothetical protein